MARPPRLRTRGPSELRHRAFDYRPPQFLKLIRYGLITAVSLALLSIAYSVYWFVTAQALREGAMRWFAERQAAGAEAGYERMVLAGFPSAIRVELTAPHITGMPGMAPWRWQGDAAAIQVRPWNLRRARLELAGVTEIEFVAAQAARHYAGDAGAITAEIAWFGDGRPREAALAIAGLGLVAEPAPENAPPDVFAVTRFDLTGIQYELDPDTGHTEPSFTLQATGAGVTLPSFVHSPLGREVAELALNGRLMGPIRFDDVRAGLGEWRDKGGTIEVDSLEARHGPLHVRANGTFALDAALQPVGALTAKIAGFFETIDALQRTNLIRSRDAAMAKVVLSALAKRPEGGGAPTLSIPVTVQDRTVYAGPVPLTTLPPIEWPEGAAPRLMIER